VDLGGVGVWSVKADFSIGYPFPLSRLPIYYAYVNLRLPCTIREIELMIRAWSTENIPLYLLDVQHDHIYDGVLFNIRSGHASDPRFRPKHLLFALPQMYRAFEEGRRLDTQNCCLHEQMVNGGSVNSMGSNEANGMWQGNGYSLSISENASSNFSITLPHIVTKASITLFSIVVSLLFQLLHGASGFPINFGKSGDPVRVIPHD